jgi:hypothetical protein
MTEYFLQRDTFTFTLTISPDNHPELGVLFLSATHTYSRLNALQVNGGQLRYLGGPVLFLLSVSHMHVPAL